jgi:hypothetical protein
MGVRSMFWIRRDIEVEHVPIQSADLTAAVLRLPDWSILIVSVYVEVNDTNALLDMVSMAKQVIQKPRNKTGTRTGWIYPDKLASEDASYKLF